MWASSTLRPLSRTAAEAVDPGLTLASGLVGLDRGVVPGTATVTGVVQERGKGDKVIVFRYKKKKQHRRTRGHAHGALGRRDPV